MDKYRPTVLSGMNVGDENNVVLKSIDEGAPSAAHFGVPVKNVFKYPAELMWVLGGRPCT